MEKAWEEIAVRCPKDSPIVGAEIGVWFGLTSASLLRALPMLHLHMVDWWRVLPTPEERNRCSVEACIGQSQEQMLAALVSSITGTAFAETRRVISVSEATCWARGRSLHSLHFAFLDADHTNDGTLSAIYAYWPLIKRGGFLCGHDYGHPSPDWGVAKAVHKFAEMKELRVTLGCDGFWCIDKPEFDE